MRKLRSIVKYWGIYYCYYYLFIGASWDPALRCDDFVCEFEFLQYYFVPTTATLFWCIFSLFVVCCIYLIFLRCSLVFVLLPVSILLRLMPLLSEPCLLFYCSSRTDDPLVFCLPIVWWAARSPSHTIEVLIICLLQFFHLLFILCLVLF